MTDLNTNKYLYNQPYLQNQPSYGDNSILDTVKNHPAAKAVTNNAVSEIKDTGVGQTIQGAVKKEDSLMTTVLKFLSYTAAGSVVGWAINKGVDVLTKGEDFVKKSGSQKSLLGKFNNFVDNRLASNDGFIKKSSKIVTTPFKAIHNKINKTKLYQSLEETYHTGKKYRSGLEFNVGLGHTVQEAARALEEVNKDGFFKNLAEQVENKTITPEKAFKSIEQQVKTQNLGSHIASNKNLSLLFNKARLMQNGSPLSKLLSKFSIGTGNFMGTGFGLVFNGVFVGQSIKEAAEAPKGEKVSTFMDDLLGNWIGGMVLMAPLAKVINGIANWKTIGFSDKTKQALDIAIKKENTLATPGNYFFFWKDGAKKLKSHDAEITKLMAIGKQEAKGAGLTIMQKLARLTGKIVGFGQYKSIWKILPGFVGRMFLVSYLADLLVGKHLRKLSWKIFGKPMNKYKDEEKEKAEKAAKSGKSDNTKINDLQKALEQNKAGMLTVSAKNQTNPVNSQTNPADNSPFPAGNMNPLIAKTLEAKLQQAGSSSTIPNNNPAGASLKISDVKPDLNKLPEENKAISGATITNKEQSAPAKHQYIPSDTRKNSPEEVEKRAKFNSTLAAADKAIEDAEKVLGS